MNEIEDKNICTCDIEDIEDHKCPYKEDVNRDSESLCNCCESCVNQCAWDI